MRSYLYIFFKSLFAGRPLIYYAIISRLGGSRPPSIVVRRSVNNARAGPTRCGGGDDTDDGYNDDGGNGNGDEDDDGDDDYYNCSLLSQNKPKMRSCRRWSQADSLALVTTPPLPSSPAAGDPAMNAAFRIGGPVSTAASPPGLRRRFGVPSSLRPVHVPPPSSLQQTQSPRRDAGPAVQDVACSTARRAPQPAADLPAIPESSQWDERHRRRGRRTPPPPPDGPDSGNGSTRASGRSASYRAFFGGGRAASPAAAATAAAAATGATTTTGHRHRDNQVPIYIVSLSYRIQ